MIYRSGGFQRLIAFICIGVICLVSLVFTCLMLRPGNWSMRTTAFYTLNVGLYCAKIDTGLVGTAAEATVDAIGLGERVHKLRLILIEFFGQEHDLLEIEHRICNINPDLCEVWSALRLSSWTALTVGSIAIVLHLVGAGVMHQYWTRNPSTASRVLYTRLLAAAPCLHLLNLVQYLFASWYLRYFPPRAQSVTWGANVVYALMCLVLSWVPFVLCQTWVKIATDERLAGAQKQLRNAEADAAVEMAIVGGTQKVLGELAKSTSAPMHGNFPANPSYAPEMTSSFRMPSSSHMPYTSQDYGIYPPSTTYAKSFVEAPSAPFNGFSPAVPHTPSSGFSPAYQVYT